MLSKQWGKSKLIVKLELFELWAHKICHKWCLRPNFIFHGQTFFSSCSKQSRFDWESKHWNQHIINTNTNYLSILPVKETRGNTVDIKLFFYFTLQTINFTKPFYARPVVLVTPKRTENNNNANLSGSRCNAVTAWVEVRITCCDTDDLWEFRKHSLIQVMAQTSLDPRDSQHCLTV